MRLIYAWRHGRDRYTELMKYRKDSLKGLYVDMESLYEIEDVGLIEYQLKNALD